MSVDPEKLRRGLVTLGELLDAIGASVEIAIVGGAALILKPLP